MLSLRSMELHVSSAHWYSLESEYVPGDFAAWMNAFPLLYRYGSVMNLYGSDFYSAAGYGLVSIVSGYGEIRPEYCFHDPV